MKYRGVWVPLQKFWPSWILERIKPMNCNHSFPIHEARSRNIWLSSTYSLFRCVSTEWRQVVTGQCLFSGWQSRLGEDATTHRHSLRIVPVHILGPASRVP